MEFLSSGFNVVQIILGFGVLIFIHELGHFLAAKWAGIRTEAFAVGMGPVMVAWRKGIGFRFGSTAAAYEKRVREHLQSQRDERLHQPENAPKPNEKSNELPPAEIYRIGDALGLGETEYSIRWLPIGGFVKMLGQEDANPNAVSDDPRSYTRCPVGKRMVVVSAGVIMNILLAMVLFVISFMVGVRFEAPVVGEVAREMPASRTPADNAAERGVKDVGLQPGDLVLRIDGEPATSFTDLQIASAMSKPGVPVHFEVQRAGFDEPLQFTILPEKDRITGLLGIGITPGASTTLSDDDNVARSLRRAGLSQAGVKPGMRLLSVNGSPITAFGQLNLAAEKSGGQPLQTVWTALDENEQPVGPPIAATLTPRPLYSEYPQRNAPGDLGLLGFSPLTRVVDVLPRSANVGLLKPGDLFIKIGDVNYPRYSQFVEVVQAHKRGTLQAVVLRDGEPATLTLSVNKDGYLMIEPGPAEDTLLTAQPVLKYARMQPDEPGKTIEVDTPVSQLDLFTVGGTQILAVNGQDVETWPQFRAALLSATADAKHSGSAATLKLLIAHPLPDKDREEVSLNLTPEQIADLHALKWSPGLHSVDFEPIQVTQTANGSPIKAVVMGIKETKKLVYMTYLTIDRLFRGTVGVEQLRGPVGIIHLGAKVADRGFMYMVFFLGMISVNLAVLNFLPMPIVDGGLFLFLVYEKFKGRPPSLAFQNAATIVGLCIIGALFIVTFYNDVLRLLG